MLKPTIGKVFKINYKNYKGEIAVRTIKINKFVVGSNQYHKEHQLLIEAFDINKRCNRVFAANNVLEWYNDSKDCQK